MKENLDHQVWKLIKLYQLEKKTILVGLSGGIDSLALLLVLKKIHPQVLAAYFHHGEGQDLRQNRYRNKAEQFVKAICAEVDVPLTILKSSKTTQLKSEADFREARYAALQAHMQSHSIEVLALAHHQDDLLETRLLRLIRGTGAQGFLSMQEFSQGIFRPFLQTPKSELVEYLSSKKRKALPDPSNRSEDPLRNWLRLNWLKSLEKKQKGAVQSLSRSLDLMAAEIQRLTTDDLWQKNATFLTHKHENAISRAFFISLIRSEQKRLLAQYLLHLKKRDFSAAQLEEICKRLDNPQKVLTFKVARLQWIVNAEQIQVQS